MNLFLAKNFHIRPPKKTNEKSSPRKKEVLLDGIAGIRLRGQEVRTLGCRVVGFQGILGHQDGLSSVAEAPVFFQWAK